MVKTALFKGSCTALITPFDQYGTDIQQLKRNIDYQYENGSAALLLASPVGEAASLDFSRRQQLLHQAMIHSQGRMKLIINVSSPDTAAAIKNAETAKALGADGILMSAPELANQAGLIEHFSAVAERIELPLLIMHCGRLSPQSCKTLSQLPNINGLVDCSGDLSRLALIRSLCGEELHIWSGRDDSLVPAMSLGALGAVSVAANLLPALVSKLCTLCFEGDYQAAMSLYSKYGPLISALDTEPQPIGIKTAMKLMERDSGLMQLPLTEMGCENRAALLSSMRDAGLNV